MALRVAGRTVGLRSLGTASRRALPSIQHIRRAAPAELEDARIDLARALDLMPAFNESTEPRRGELLRLLATTNIRLGDYLAAEEILEDARDIEDRHLAMKGPLPDGGAARVETEFLLGVCYQKTGREEQAKTMFGAVLKEDDGHWRARFHTALLFLDEGEFDEAEDLLVSVLEDEPAHETAGQLLSKLRERKLAAANKLEVPLDGDK